MGGERPNYYAIIPAEVRYSNIKPNAKLLYGEITALTNKKGYCFASNNYFAELYNVSKNTISLWIAELKRAGFVSVLIVWENKQVKERRMSITKLSGRYHEKKGEGITKKEEVNNTRINTTSNLSIRKEEFIASINFLNVSRETRTEFINYWTEENHSKTKMKFELERTWDIKKRLERWINNSKKWNTNTTKKSRIKTSLSAHEKAKEMVRKMNDNSNNEL
tara:strand:+ start:96 stop:758 length:663 start_codon:yes stop_codon:yes gene_type:complete